MWLLRKIEREALREFFDHYEWVHITLGLVGNFLFFVGSILFFYDSLKTVGVWLFVIGSFLMLVGSCGDALVKYSSKESGQNGT